ncbi:basic leucine zipper 19-like [Mangifera indica]|uniref:basic leucine zipper 19-like n=1 Tax=Mangifera indica TaxID=29780 RepID=UPI001CFA4BEF|nr:basic leucine zipper 19-like [Mangifera indica]
MARPATDSCRLLVHGSVEFPSIKMSVEGKTQSSLCSSPFSFLPPTFVGAKRMEGKGAYKRLGNGLPPIPFSLNRSNGGANRETMSSENLSTTVDADLDKKQKRVLASRQYSQKYRLKQLHYILQLETEVKALQAEVAITSPRIRYVHQQNSLLRAENSSMTKKLSAIASEFTFKEAQYEELKRENEILKKLYQLQLQATGMVKSKSVDQNDKLGFKPYASMSSQMLNRNMNPFAPGQI